MKMKLLFLCNEESWATCLMNESVKIHREHTKKQKTSRDSTMRRQSSCQFSPYLKGYACKVRASLGVYSVDTSVSVYKSAMAEQQRKEQLCLGMNQKIIYERAEGFLSKVQRDRKCKELKEAVSEACVEDMYSYNME